MRNIVDRLWRRVTVVVLLVGMDIAISLPIMGATYRPFSWMSIAPADVATLYPVIQDLSFVDGALLDGSPRAGAEGESRWAALTVEVSPGARVILQRSINLLDAAGWRDVASTTAMERVILMIDTNPVSRTVFYRVKQLLGGSP